MGAGASFRGTDSKGDDREDHVSDNLKNTLQCIDDDAIDDNDDFKFCRDIALTFVHSNFSLVAGEIKNIPLSLSITSLISN